MAADPVGGGLLLFGGNTSTGPNPQFAGRDLYIQGFALSPSYNALGALLTDGHTLRLGLR